MMDVKGVNKALRSGLWAPLRERGFVLRTGRSAWRYAGGAVDVVDVQSVGANADACGCTSSSFNAFVACVPRFQQVPPDCLDKDGRARPHYWNCSLQLTLTKTLQQPWFAPFARAPSPKTPPSFLAHRALAMKVLRRDRHDRPDIWFVLEDGSNIDEVFRDLLSVVEDVGLPMLDRFHDPCQVVDLVKNSALRMTPDSPLGQELISEAGRACGEGPQVE